MIKVKIEEGRFNKPKLFMQIDEKLKNEPLFKRAVLEGKMIKSWINIPLRFFLPIIKNYKVDEIKINKKSIKEFFEFYDYYGEEHFSSTQITPTFMRKWRENGCPEIIKIEYNNETKKFTWRTAVKRTTDYI